MILTRRGALATGGGFAASLLAARTGFAAAMAEIAMRGTKDGGRIWFDPVGLYIEPGQRLRFLNRDGGNTHTATAYSPDIDGRPLRFPQARRAGTATIWTRTRPSRSPWRCRGSMISTAARMSMREWSDGSSWDAPKTMQGGSRTPRPETCRPRFWRRFPLSRTSWRWAALSRRGRVMP